MTLNKPAYIGIYILELNEVLMHEFYHDYIKNKHGNNSKLLFTDSDSLMYEIKTIKMSIKIVATIKKCLTLVIIQESQNIIIRTN